MLFLKNFFQLLLCRASAYIGKEVRSPKFEKYATTKPTKSVPLGPEEHEVETDVSPPGKQWRGFALWVVASGGKRDVKIIYIMQDPWKPQKMDGVEKRVLTQMRSKLIKEMVVTESFLSAFCHNNVLDDSTSSLLKCERNYEHRASKLLELLPSRGSKAFLTLMEILEITNPWLSEKMRAALHDERNKDAKINLHPAVSKSASIEGFGELRLHIDRDIKERSARYVRTNLYHLTEVEQRGVDKWLADELQRERRRQQFRAPHKMSSDSREFHASKECQTDTSFMDMRDIFEEMATYLHGVDVVELDGDISFGKMQGQIRELLARTRKLDALFLNCLNKFDDATKYTMTLPELIEKTVHHEKDLQLAESESKKVVQKLREENDGLKRHIRRLEEHIDRLIQRQTQGMRPQEIQLRQRQDVHFRYTLPAPADSGHFAVNRAIRSANNNRGDKNLNDFEDTEDINGNCIAIYYNGQAHGSDPNDNSAYHNPDENKGMSHRGVSEVEGRANINAQDLKRKGSIDFSHHSSSNFGQTYPHAAGHKIHKAEPVHYEDQSNASSQSTWNSSNKINYKSSQHSNGGQKNVKVSKEPNASPDHPKQYNSRNNDSSLKLRRHASEESIRIEVAQAQNEFTLTTRLDSAQLEPPSRRSSHDNTFQSASSTPQPKQPKQQTKEGGSSDIQNRLQKMLSDTLRQHQNQQRRGSRGETEKFLLSSGTNITNEVLNQAKKHFNRYRDSSPGNKSLRASQEDISLVKLHPKSKNKSIVSSVEFTDKGFMSQQHILFQHNMTSSNNVQQSALAPDPAAERQNLDENPTRFSRKHPTRSSSSDRTNPNARPIPSLSVVSPGSHSPGYLSDSELMLKKSSIRGKTVRLDRGRVRVRFATPVVKSNPSQGKIPARTHRPAHYQMDTASTAIRKNQFVK